MKKTLSALLIFLMSFSVFAATVELSSIGNSIIRQNTSNYTYIGQNADELRTWSNGDSSSDGVYFTEVYSVAYFDFATLAELGPVSSVSLRLKVSDMQHHSGGLGEPLCGVPLSASNPFDSTLYCDPEGYENISIFGVVPDRVTGVYDQTLDASFAIATTNEFQYGNFSVEADATGAWISVNLNASAVAIASETGDGLYALRLQFTSVAGCGFSYLDPLEDYFRDIWLTENGYSPECLAMLNRPQEFVNFDASSASLIVTTVPVPAAFWLFASALAGLGWNGRRLQGDRFVR